MAQVGSEHLAAAFLSAFAFTTRLSDDGIHPDYALDGELHRAGAPPVQLQWRSAHHDEGFRGNPYYRWLFL